MASDRQEGDMTFHPPRMQRADGQRLIFKDAKMIEHSTTTETTGDSSSDASSFTASTTDGIECSSKQENKHKGFRGKLHAFKVKFDQLDQERRASRHHVQQSVQRSQSNSSNNDNIHHMQIELLKKMNTKIDQMGRAMSKDPPNDSPTTDKKSSEGSSSHQLQLQQNELLEKMMYRLLQENEQLRTTCREQEKNQSKFDAIMPEIDDLISSVNHMQAENDKLQEENESITLLLERMTDKMVKDDQQHEDCIKGYKKEIADLNDKINRLENSEEELNWKLVKKLEKKKEEVKKLKAEIAEAYNVCEVLSKEVEMLKGGNNGFGMKGQDRELDAIQEEGSLQDDDDDSDSGSEGLR